MWHKACRKVASLWMVCIVSLSAVAQQASFKVAIDSSMLLIGEQSALHLSLTAPKESRLLLPVFADTLVTGIEIVERSAVDTLITKEGLMQLTQNYLITSFDSGLYYMQPFRAVYNDDTIYSNPLALKVLTIPIDSASIDMMRDIKEVMNPPFVWKDYLYVLYVLLLLLLVTAALYYGRKYWKSKGGVADESAPVVLLPPHVEALQGLDQIKERKLWQQGLDKEYYTAVTDVLRVYIKRRYEIDAIEMTSDEILKGLAREKCEKTSIKYLKQLLGLADLVKFAKFKPLPDENDLSMTNACLFVEATKQVEETENDGQLKENEGGSSENVALNKTNN